MGTTDAGVAATVCPLALTASPPSPQAPLGTPWSPRAHLENQRPGGRSSGFLTWLWPLDQSVSLQPLMSHPAALHLHPSPWSCQTEQLPLDCLCQAFAHIVLSTQNTLTHLYSLENSNLLLKSGSK